MNLFNVFKLFKRQEYARTVGELILLSEGSVHRPLFCSCCSSTGSVNRHPLELPDKPLTFVYLCNDCAERGVLRFALKVSTKLAESPNSGMTVEELEKGWP